MKIGLFIPCYIDAFFPEVGIATLELLEKLGCSVEYPLEQTCCGQPMANSGCERTMTILLLAPAGEAQGT
jgi:L-lactate dehydrogenase complex protein LldE